ncbi:MAG: oligosaccharide repeat unit polymerase [Planctomycetes bacterium]|nr:oligosaccharide repeat unit polymerase [Planctomycetota bacterium]
MIRRLTNPLGLFLLIWGAAVILYLGGMHQGMFPSPLPMTVAMILLNVVTFTLGYLTWTLFRGLDPSPADIETIPARRLTPQAMGRMLKFTLAMGVAALALEMQRVLAIASRFDTNWRDLINDPEQFRIRIVAFITESLYQTSGTVMLLSITSSLFSIGFVLLGVLLHTDRTRKKYLYATSFLAVSLAIGLIHLSRYEMTSNFLYMVFAYVVASRMDQPTDRIPRRSVSARRLVVPVAGVVLLFFLIDVLLHKSGEYGLSSRLQGVLFHFYWYIAGPLAAFNEFIANFSGDHQWGQSMFLPLYKWLCRFHLAQEVEVNYYGEKVLVPYMSNVYTYLRNFYEDFGVLGVAVVPYVLGWTSAAIREKARRHLQYLNLYLVLLLFILFSFYNYYLSSNQIYLQILFGFVLFRYRIPDGQQDSMLRRYQESST